MKHDREVLSTPALSESARQISANQDSREAAIENFLDVVARLVARAHARQNRLEQKEAPPAEKGEKGRRRRRKSAPAESEIASGPVGQETTNGGGEQTMKETQCERIQQLLQLLLRVWREAEHAETQVYLSCLLARLLPESSANSTAFNSYGSVVKIGLRSPTSIVL